MSRKNPVQRTGSEHQKAVTALLRELAHRHSLWTVFRDFVAMAALMLSNVADRSQFDTREAEYLKIAGAYSRDELEKFAQVFAHVVMGLESGHQDFLGSLFMQLELGDSWKGQFFTGYELCLCMAKMTSSGAVEPIRARGFVQVSDPCVGGGAMIIASAHALLDEGVNYQRHMHAVGQDIDLTAVHMAYVQLSLLHIPALVIHGNSLTNEVRSVWRTLAHTMGGWDFKLRHSGHLPSHLVSTVLPPSHEAGPLAQPASVSVSVPGSASVTEAGAAAPASPSIDRPAPAVQTAAPAPASSQAGDHASAAEPSAESTAMREAMASTSTSRRPKPAEQFSLF